MPSATYTPKAFISGTHKDLQSERRVASQECIKRGILPLGMDIFPAAAQLQWEFIKDNMDLCDFVILLIGGRYGAINNSPGADNAISFTHSEYRYAIDKKIPVFAIVRELSLGQILDANVDLGEAMQQNHALLMQAFRTEVLGNGFMAYVWGRGGQEPLADFTGGVALTLDAAKAYCIKRNHENELKNAFLTQGIQARSTSNDFDHAPLIRSAKTARIIMNDGFRFFRKYRDDFINRTKSKLNTEVCLLATEGPHIQTISDRSRKTVSAQQHNINESLDELKLHAKSAPFGRFRIYTMMNFFPYCAFEYDNTIIISMYLAFERVEELPMFIFRRTTTPSDIYFTLHMNIDMLFRSAETNDAPWFKPRDVI